ncbi:hypothetical protein KIN20_024305 [Parelaphostrongylus tenuis]|uniref:Uncharacterized protein n=1 Tax=Parelaphostrongylus tenuis TaxID=148309 RepID=A0AAD5QVV8_PARTN|nr:hypothetical protein KIN20_024305 [Parelaphostrongylus tenuis]
MMHSFSQYELPPLQQLIKTVGKERAKTKAEERTHVKVISGAYGSDKASRNVESHELLTNVQYCGDLRRYVKENESVEYERHGGLSRKENSD